MERGYSLALSVPNSTLSLICSR